MPDGRPPDPRSRWVRWGDQAGDVLALWRRARRAVGARPLPAGRYRTWVPVATATGVATVLTTFRLAAETGAGRTVLTVVATVLAIATLYAAHRVRLIRLARRPGPVAVPTVQDATAGQDAPVAELTLLLRRHLAGVHLYAQSLVPGNAPPQDFVALAQTAAGEKTWLARVVRLVTALPTHAYTVHATALRSEDPQQPCGMSVQLRAYPSWTSPPYVCWARDWSEAMTPAAMAIAAQILPWTRQGLDAPWTDWADAELPPGLLDAYQYAKSCVPDRRYDEALGAYFDALRLDPGNLHLRLEVAAVYHKLALWLDALEAYQTVVHDADNRLRASPFPTLGRHNRACRSALSAAHKIARYRYIVTLGWGELLARQWVKGLGEPPRTRREKQRDQLRDSLGKPLADDLAEIVASAAEAEGLSMPPHLVERALHTPATIAEPMLRLAFQLLAVREVDLALKEPFDAHRWRQVDLSRASLELIRVWLRLRLRAAKTDGALREAGSHPRTDPESPTHALARLLGQSIPTKLLDETADPETLVNEVMDAMQEPEWLDRYNAACVLAQPLLERPSTSTDPRDTELVEASIAQLGAATAMMSSARLSQLRAWIATEDPDLRGLRETCQFQAFVQRALPGPSPYVSRPANAHMLELALHTAQTARRSVRLFAQQWRERADSTALPLGDELIEVWRREVASWESLARLAVDHQHWPTRARLISELGRWCADHRRPAPNWAHPDFVTWAVDPSGGPSAPRTETQVREWVSASDARFDRLSVVVAQVRTDNTGWAAWLDDLDDAGLLPSPARWHELCRHRRRLWHLVDVWLRDDPATARDDRFSAGITAELRGHAPPDDASAARADPPDRE